MHHVWSQFTEIKYDNWGELITRGINFSRSGDTPDSDLVDFVSWLDHFINHDGSFVSDPYELKYDGYNPANMQARYLTSKHPNPHLVNNGDTFEPSEADAIESYKKHDWVGINDFFHESLCLFYFRFATNNPKDDAQRYVEEKCTCSVRQKSSVSAVHVMHHDRGHRSTLLDLSPTTINKVMNLTKIDRPLFKHILQDFIRDMIWLESALGRRILCDEKLETATKELAYLDLSVAETYYFLKGDKNNFNSEMEEQNDSGFIVVSIFKNEAMNFAEWISHYLWQGASHFYLIDNGSTDDWKSTILSKHLEKITVISYEARHVQIRSYNSLLPMLQQKHPHDWALVVDLDEFLFGKPPEKIASYLLKVSNDIGQVTIPWTMFGSSNHTSHPESVRCSFVRCSNHTEDTPSIYSTCKVHANTKGIARISRVESFNIHKHLMITPHLPGFQTHYETKNLQLNHYAIQSKDYFEKIKLKRGDVSHSSLDSIRGWDYFNNYNNAFSGREDTELCSILGCCKD